MKRVLISALVILALLLGSFYVSYSLSKGPENSFEFMSLAKLSDSDDEFYLSEVERDAFFLIYYDSESEHYNSLYKVQDNEGKSLELSIEKIKQGQFKILPPEGGYTPGEKYTITLNSGASFAGDQLANVRTLIFSVHKDSVENYTFSEKVTEVTDELRFNSEDSTIILPDGDIDIGDIVMGKDNSDDIVVYKVTEIKDETNAVVEEPALEEIFSDLEVYGDYNLIIDDILTNPDIEAEIIENVKRSSFFDSLISTAYAEEAAKKDIPIKVALTEKDGGLEVKITIQLSSSGKSLFSIEKLKNHQINIVLTNFLKPTVTANINGVTNFDIGYSTSSRASIELEVTRQKNTSNDGEPYKHNFADIFTSGRFKDLPTYKSYVNEITKDLAEIVNDRSRGEIELFDWPVPILGGIAGINVKVKLNLDYSMSAEFAFGKSIEIETCVGITYVNKEFRSYSNVHFRDGFLLDNISISGKLDAKLGLTMDVCVYLISEKFAKIGFDPGVGLYFDAFVTFPVKTPADLEDPKWLYAYAEFGLYFDVSFNARVKLLIKEISYSKEIIEVKTPLLDFGNYKIASGLVAQIQTVQCKNNRVPVPDILFSYYDARKAVYKTEILDPHKLKFTVSDGSGLIVEDNEIIPTGAASSSTAYVTASYLHADGQYYNAMFRVILSGSVIEGTVSAYSPDTSLSVIEAATVELYDNSDSPQLLSQGVTDELGKFSFSVSEGEYKLIVKADGYQELTSTQQVGVDEIKYTEHILLIDDTQSGLGTAAGRTTNAINGQALSNVEIKLRPNWNNQTGQYVEGYVSYSSSNGNYSVSGIPVGYYTLEAKLDGYFTSYCNIIVQSSTPKNDHNFTMSPVLAEHEVRVVLTWGSSPRDLDSHLIGHTPTGNDFNVYFGSKVYSLNHVEVANLDVDDTSSYGPETITILKPINGRTVYYVHDYSNRNSSSSTQLSYSDAIVRVYRGGLQIAEYHVPTGQIGTYWAVFFMDDHGAPVPINTLSNSKPLT